MTLSAGQSDIAGNRSAIDWEALRGEWSLAPGVTYLNHGSFGPSPRKVIESRERWSRLLEQNPMDFFVRQCERDLDQASEVLGRFVGAKTSDLVFVPNATVAMNIVAANLSLQPGDEVLTTNHDYGAVLRIWRSACKAADAALRLCPLPLPLTDDDAIVEAIASSITSKTKLLVVSHVTSASAAVMPVEKICKIARQRGVPVCVDGPHAIAMRPVNLRALDCDYYCASLHKWLSAPFGSGFLYVAPRRQSTFRPLITSWGGRLNGGSAGWRDEFTWTGTSDPAAYLATTTAIEFLESVGLPAFRERTHALAKFAAEKITALTGLPPLVTDSIDGYGSMISLPLPVETENAEGHPLTDPWQQLLWENHQIEVPIMHVAGQRLLRVSCHLYNTESDIERLTEAVSGLLQSARSQTTGTGLTES